MTNDQKIEHFHLEDIGNKWIVESQFWALGHLMLLVHSNYFSVDLF